MQNATPPVPRLAATVLVVHADPAGGRFQVLMTRRHKDMFFSSALVFPGGVVDETDRAADWRDHISGDEGLDDAERALRIAACRETFEETGLLLAASSGPRDEICAVPDGTFLDLVRARGVVLCLDQVQPFAHWVTPETAPKRYDTHFYLCRAAPGAEAVCDGREAVSLEWLAPADLLNRPDASGIMFPTRLNLQRLAESETVEDAFAAAAARPAFTVMVRAEKRPGGVAMVIPIEAGYGAVESFQPHEPR
jgi:8-oxo-dGTP pyrophosphatase MutT (NUDIX family)